MAEWLALPQAAVAPGLADRPVAWRGDTLVRRAAFLADVAAWHASFAAQPGRRFALYFDDGYEFAAALFGAWHAGKEVHLPGDAQSATLARLLPEVDGCAGLLPGALTPAAGAATARLEPLDLQATRLVVFTSGSSGEPIAIPKQLAQLDAEIHTLQAAFGARIDAAGPATVLATVSHQHIYGLLFVTLWSLAAGRPFVGRRFDYPEEIAACTHAPSILVSSPAHLRRLPATLDWRRARGALQAVFSSGGPLPPEAAGAALQLVNRSPIEVYGSSETGGIAWRQRAEHGERWQALPGVQWRVDEGDLLAVRSRHLADDAWWQTADRVEPLSDASFVLLGRADRIVKIEEKRVSLTAIERALLACPEVAEARVLPLDARIAVVAVLSKSGRLVLQRDGKRALNDRLRAALLQAVERVVLPRRWRYVRALPVNPQGKVTEAALLALFRPAMPEARWTERSAGSATAVLDVVPELAVFDGHFPDAPILPGVAQLDWAVRFGRECFALPPQVLRIDTLKFHRPVSPGTQLTLTLTWRAEAGVLDFRYSTEAGVHAGGAIVFASAR